MTYQIITEWDLSAGIHVVFQYLNYITDGYFMAGCIFLIYMVLGLGMFFAQKRMTGFGRAPLCFMVSSLIMIPFVIFLAMIPGLVNGKVILEIIAMNTIGILWLFFSRE